MSIHLPSSLSRGSFSLAVVALAGASTVVAACGGAEPDDASGRVAAQQGALLGIPGAFYTQAPAFGFCGSSSLQECHPGYSFNSRGALPTFLKRAVGLYRITFDNQPANGNVQVSASGSNAHCNLAAQFPSGSGVGLDVACRGTNGQPADSKFMLSYYKDVNVGGPLGGYAYVSGVTPFATSNTWNSSGGPITVQAFGPGVYRVTFTGQAAGNDNAQVTALTSGGAYCTVGAAGWLGGNVDVRCFTSTGVPANVSFSVSYGHNVRGEPRNTLVTGSQGALVVVGSGGGVDPTRSTNSCQAGANAAVLQQPGNLYTETYHVITTTQGEVPLMSLVSGMSNSGVYCNLNHFPIQGVRSESHGYVNCFTPQGASTVSTHSSMFLIQDRSGC